MLMLTNTVNLNFSDLLLCQKETNSISYIRTVAILSH